MIKFYISALLLLATAVRGQYISPQQVHYPGTEITFNPSLFNYPCATDNQGSHFFCGFKDNATFYNVGQGNLFFRKVTTGGAIAFNKTIEGNVHPYQMVTDGEHVYLAVSYITNLQIGSLSLVSANQAEHPVVIKFDAEGNYIWHKTIPGSNPSASVALTAAGDGSLYIGYDNFTTSYVEKLQPDGTTEFTISQDQVSNVSSIAVDPAGNIAVAGSCAATSPSFNGVVQSNSLLYNSYLAYYNAQQQFQWVQFVQDITCVDPMTAMDQQGNVYFSSTLSDNFSVAGQPTEGPSLGSLDFFLTKFTPTGNLEWVREVPGSASFSVPKRKYLAVDNQGFVYLAGSIKGLAQWTPTIQSSTGTQFDLVILVYSSQGEVVQAQTGGSSSTYDFLHNISINQVGRGAISGISAGNGQFGSVTLTPGTTGFTPYLIDFSLPNLSDSNVALLPSFTLAPNPSAQQTVLYSQQLRGEAALYTVTGQLVRRLSIDEPITTVDLSGISKGVYWVKLGDAVKKLVIN